MSNRETGEISVPEFPCYVDTETDNECIDEKRIKELEAEIESILKELNEITPGEKLIIEKMRQSLDKQGYEYSYKEDEPKQIMLDFGEVANKPVKIHINLQEGKAIFRLFFPFRIQCNAYPLMCMFLAEYNANEPFGQLHLNPDESELTIDYSFMLENPEHFDEHHFWVYLASLIQNAMEIYTKAARFSVGMVPGQDREMYRKLLEMALEIVAGEFDDEDVDNGISRLRQESLPHCSQVSGESDELFKEGDEPDKKETVPNSDGEDDTQDFIRYLMEQGVPVFKGPLNMNEMEEGALEKEAKEQPKKSPGVLSMFAKRDDEGNVNECTAHGGNEDG